MKASSHDPHASRLGPLRAMIPHLPALALFLALAFVVTYPLWIHPSVRIGGRGDALLNSYILDWVHFALFHQLGDFFQSSVFWPHADGLAYGEHLLVPALLILPLRIFTSSAVALHNFSVVQAFFFSAAAAYALAHFYFRSRSAATVAGLVYGFAQYRLVQIGHIQLAHAEFFPLAVLGFEMLLRNPTRGAAALLGASLAAQALTSWYWAVFCFWTLGPFFAVRLWQSRDELTRSHLAHFLVPCVLAVMITLPVAVPYMQLERNNIFVRPPEAYDGLSARPGDFVVASPRYWIAPSEKYSDATPVTERHLFPGVVALVVVLIGMALIFLPRKDSGATLGVEHFPKRLWFGLFGVLFVFSFGSSFSLGEDSAFAIPLPYLIIQKFFPFASGVRVTARWILPALLPVAMLAAYGAVRLVSLFERRSYRVIGKFIPMIMVVLLASDSLPRPSRFMEVPSEPPEFCTWLAKQEYPTPIIELPILSDSDNLYMLHATWHRQPTMNGTNGFFPPDHQKALREIGTFGSPDVLTKLAEAQVKYLIVHPSMMKRELMAQTPMGRLLDEADSKSAGGEFALNVFGQKCMARKMGDALVIDAEAR